MAEDQQQEVPLEIIVPKKEAGKKVSTGELIGISSSIASLAGLIIALLRL